ncbi:Hypothetical protein Bdt_2281 [Bdellovibrio bacteriovorus str. Tiberius]|uniref:Uncharacterized protein n=1 Tax=Bdellovibrio bacteriovorus str. Tiberius TaxID=1069642 RepID=K7ZAY9_BDEBC|nr:Hypothetical protein Bdt_2281 [Bdellovibrio bacteriovorus str. Tiberius]
MAKVLSNFGEVGGFDSVPKNKIQGTVSFFDSPRVDKAYFLSFKG